MAKEEKDKSVNGRKSSVISKLMFGQVVTSDFFARNWVSMLMILFCLLTYISGKYTCMTKMSMSVRLERQVDETHKEYVRLRSEYMGKIRESQMKARIDSLRMGLELRENPPFTLSSKDIPEYE